MSFHPFRRAGSEAPKQAREAVQTAERSLSASVDTYSILCDLSLPSGAKPRLSRRGVEHEYPDYDSEEELSFHEEVPLPVVPPADSPCATRLVNELLGSPTKLARVAAPGASGEGAPVVEVVPGVCLGQAGDVGIPVGSPVGEMGFGDAQVGAYALGGVLSSTDGLKDLFGFLGSDPELGRFVRHTLEWRSKLWAHERARLNMVLQSAVRRKCAWSGNSDALFSALVSGSLDRAFVLPVGVDMGTAASDGLICLMSPGLFGEPDPDEDVPSLQSEVEFRAVVAQGRGWAAEHIALGLLSHADACSSPGMLAGFRAMLLRVGGEDAVRGVCKSLSYRCLGLSGPCVSCELRRALGVGVRGLESTLCRVRPFCGLSLGPDSAAHLVTRMLPYWGTRGGWEMEVSSQLGHKACKVVMTELRRILKSWMCSSAPCLAHWWDAHCKPAFDAVLEGQAGVHPKYLRSVAAKMLNAALDAVYVKVRTGTASSYKMDVAGELVDVPVYNKRLAKARGVHTILSTLSCVRSSLNRMVVGEGKIVGVPRLQHTMSAPVRPSLARATSLPVGAQ